MEKTKAWKLGYAAYFRGISLLDSPYPMGSEEYKQWGNGLFAALGRDQSLFDFPIGGCDDDEE
jgi:hypothetical protein